MPIASPVKESGGKMKTLFMHGTEIGQHTHGIKTEQNLVYKAKAKLRNIQLGATHLKQTEATPEKN